LSSKARGFGALLAAHSSRTLQASERTEQTSMTRQFVAGRVLQALSDRDTSSGSPRTRLACRRL